MSQYVKLIYRKHYTKANKTNEVKEASFFILLP